MMSPRCILLLPTLLFVVNAQSSSPGKFDTGDCLKCLEQQDLDSPLSTTYCEVSEDSYTCLSTNENCTGTTIDWAPNCLDVDLDDVLDTARNVVIAVVVISFLCCAAIIGGIVACVFCCIKSGSSGSNHHPHHPTVYQQPQPAVTQPQEAALILPGTLTTPVETGLAKEP